MNQTDVKILKRGLRHVGIALLTALIFVLSVAGFVVVAITPGYVAVFLFFGSLISMASAFLLLYAQGLPPMSHKESQGEDE